MPKVTVLSDMLPWSPVPSGTCPVLSPCQAAKHSGAGRGGLGARGGTGSGQRDGDRTDLGAGGAPVVRGAYRLGDVRPIAADSPGCVASRASVQTGLRRRDGRVRPRRRKWANPSRLRPSPVRKSPRGPPTSHCGAATPPSGTCPKRQCRPSRFTAGTSRPASRRSGVRCTGSLSSRGMPRRPGEPVPGRPRTPTGSS
ncbi:hypothetical protein JOF58_000773 [Streptomyces cinnamonensis]|nr:hypothetical protein [Streptomyces virginiae]